MSRPRELQHTTLRTTISLHLIGVADSGDYVVPAVAEKLLVDCRWLCIAMQAEAGVRAHISGWSRRFRSIFFWSVWRAQAKTEWRFPASRRPAP